MSQLRFGTSLCLSLLLLMSTGIVRAATLYVNCGGKTGFSTIGMALKALKYSESSGPSTINVSGACRENVVIQSVDRLTLNAAPGTSISDPSGGNSSTLVIDDSRDVTVTGFTINGGADGIDCENGSLCRLNGNTVENSQSDGVGVFSMSQVILVGGTLRSHQFAGLDVTPGTRAQATGVNTQGSVYGAFVHGGASLKFVASTSSGNQDAGILVRGGSSLVCNGCTVTDNGNDGIRAEGNSSVEFYPDFSVNGPYTVARNAGYGVSLNTVSSAQFGRNGSVSSNSGSFDLACNTTASEARDLANVTIPAGRTNCTGP
ncbi:MAG: hypothetical protein C5B58_08980 [Acidobacteria bacterium]|nr:MAG: hypothetical protein C5B58_08980 [Acidobacteriota bacterium]